MTAEELRDVRAFILITLYRVNPLGRNARYLHTLAAREVAGTLADFHQQLEYLRGKRFVDTRAADKDLSPGLDPFWFITTEGMAHCEESHLV